MIGHFFPLRIQVFGRLTVVDIPFLTYAHEPHLGFIVRIKICPHSNGTVNDFYLRAISRDGHHTNIPLALETLEHTNVVKSATAYSKGADIGPFEAVFEIPQRKLQTTISMRDWVRETKFRLVLEVGSHPVTKTVVWKQREAP